MARLEGQARFLRMQFGPHIGPAVVAERFQDSIVRRVIEIADKHAAPGKLIDKRSSLLHIQPRQFGHPGKMCVKDKEGTGGKIESRGQHDALVGVFGIGDQRQLQNLRLGDSALRAREKCRSLGAVRFGAHGRLVMHVAILGQALGELRCLIASPFDQRFLLDRLERDQVGVRGFNRCANDFAALGPGAVLGDVVVEVEGHYFQHVVLLPPYYRPSTFGVKCGILGIVPELPELQVVAEVLQRRVVGQTVTAVEMLPGSAIVVRDLTHDGFSTGLTGATITSIARRGKFLVFGLTPPLCLVLNPKLAGRLQLAAPGEKRFAKTHVVFTLSNGIELRYLDQKRMGQLYLTRDLERIPDFAGLGPEPFDISPEEFRTRIRSYQGEIKGILTRGQFLAGIGNAYADEILWAAHVHPYRKRKQLTAAEIDALYAAIQTTLRDAVEKVRAEVGEKIHLEPRTFLAVHMKSGEPCPRCGTPISVVSANQRITNFCRTCQPGGLIRGM